MLFLPASLLLSVVLCGASAAELRTYTRRDPVTGETLTCDRCPPGQHMVAHCTATTRTECAPCEVNRYTELWNYLPKCLYCDNLCTRNQEVEKECAPDSNRVCRCKEGFFGNSDHCMAHSKCGPGQGVRTKGTSQMNTVCEDCRGGYFSNTSSELEPCVKQQECANCQIVLFSSAYQDALCGTCKDLGNGSATHRAFLSIFFSEMQMSHMHKKKLRRFVSRNINNSGECNNQKGLQNKIRWWLDEAPVEKLKKIPQMLKDVALTSVSEKLETRLREIEQQATNCTLTL